jgi:uncharacterized membrane protein (UPF0127 family)
VREFRLETGDGRTVCERCARAESPLQRMRGLLGRRSLETGECILLRPAGSIHTAFMRFAIDAVFVDGEGRVVRVADSIPPWRAAGAKGAKAVVELPAGAAASAGIRAGERLLLPV